jgi:hypothetical protein
MKMAQDFSLKTGQKKQVSSRLRKSDFKHHFYLESFGVKIGVSSNAAEAIEALKKALEIYLPDCFTEIEKAETEHNFLFIWNKNEKDSLSKNGEKIFHRELRETSVESAASRIRLTVAEFAVGHVFIHSGVVAWKGKAIVIPARSFGGKTTLTAALIKRGALYYSDEYAILDKEGLVHPFPKTLSIRGIIDKYRQVEHTVEAVGGKAATEKTRIGMFLITQYKPSAKWSPKILSPAKGILEIIRHTVPIRTNPASVLNVLNKATRDAVIVKSNRGDVSKSADLILDFFENNCF